MSTLTVTKAEFVDVIVADTFPTPAPLTPVLRDNLMVLTDTQLAAMVAELARSAERPITVEFS